MKLAGGRAAEVICLSRILTLSRTVLGSRTVLTPLHLADFVGLGAAWSLNLYGGALGLADQRARGG